MEDQFSNSTDQELENRQVTLGVSAPLTSFLGISATIAHMMLLCASGRFIPQTELGPFATLCAVAGIAIAFFLCGALSDIITKHRPATLALSVVLSLPLFLLMHINPQAMFTVHVLCSFACGAGYALSFVLWSEVLCSITPHVDKELTGLAIIVGAAVAWPISRMGDSYIYITALLLPVISSILLVQIWNTHSALLTLMDVPKAESIKRQHITFSPAASTCAGTAALGIVLSMVIDGSQTSTLYTWVPIAAVALACVLVIYDAYHRQHLNEEFLIMFFIPTVLILIIPVLVQVIWVNLICCFLIITSLVMQLNDGLSALSGHVRQSQLSAIHVFGIGRGFAALGFALGWGVGILFLRPGIVRGASANISIMVISAFIVVMILVSTFILKNHYPKAKDQVSAEDEAYDEKTELDQRRRGKWQRCCDTLSQQCGLSARQQEVLWMLAKGRDALYIEEHLNISNHTVKAHIYNIYQKTGVHSRQELFERLEALEEQLEEGEQLLQ